MAADLAAAVDSGMSAALMQRTQSLPAHHRGLGPPDLCYFVRQVSRPGLLRTTTYQTGDAQLHLGVDVTSASSLAAFCTTFNQQRVWRECTCSWNACVLSWRGLAGPCQGRVLLLQSVHAAGCSRRSPFSIAGAHGALLRCPGRVPRRLGR
jgi:hypothetical protein